MYESNGAIGQFIHEIMKDETGREYIDADFMVPYYVDEETGWQHKIFCAIVLDS